MRHNEETDLEGRRGGLRILIVQDVVYPYRDGIYEALARHEDVRTLWVTARTAPREFVPHNYHVEVLRSRTLGKFVWLDLPRDLLGRFDVAIAMFDVRHVGAYLGLRPGGPKVVLWGHGFGRATHFRAVRLFRTALARSADALLFYDVASRDTFMDTAGLPRARGFVAKNTQVVANHGPGPTPPALRLLFVGRLRAAKRIDILIRAAAQLAREGYGRPDSGEPLLRIVGSGPERDGLAALIERLDCGAEVELHPAVYAPERLKALFHTSAAYLTGEQVGLGVVHAFAYGRPVVYNPGARNAPEVSYCDDDNSLTYAGTAEALAEVLRRLAGEIEGGGYEVRARAAYATYRDHAAPQDMVEGFVDVAKYVCRALD